MKQLATNWCGLDGVCYVVPVTAGLGAQMSRPLLSHGGRGPLGVVTLKYGCGPPCPSGSGSGRRARLGLSSCRSTASSPCAHGAFWGPQRDVLGSTALTPAPQPRPCGSFRSPLRSPPRRHRRGPVPPEGSQLCWASDPLCQEESWQTRGESLVWDGGVWLGFRQFGKRSMMLIMADTALCRTGSWRWVHGEQEGGPGK